MQASEREAIYVIEQGKRHILSVAPRSQPNIPDANVLYFKPKFKIMYTNHPSNHFHWFDLMAHTQFY